MAESAPAWTLKGMDLFSFCIIMSCLMTGCHKRDNIIDRKTMVDFEVFDSYFIIVVMV